MNIRNMFTREFALDVCERYARGEDIETIAGASGNLPGEIEALLKAYHREMQEAVDRMAGIPAKAGRARGALCIAGNAVERTAAAMERIAGSLEKLVELFAKEGC